MSDREELFEEIGQLADKLDAGLYALKLPGLPDRLHIEGMSGIMRETRDKRAEIVRRETGDDPWADNPLEG